MVGCPLKVDLRWVSTDVALTLRATLVCSRKQVQKSGNNRQPRLVFMARGSAATERAAGGCNLPIKVGEKQTSHTGIRACEVEAEYLGRLAQCSYGGDGCCCLRLSRYILLPLHLSYTPSEDLEDQRFPRSLDRKPRPPGVTHQSL